MEVEQGSHAAWMDTREGRGKSPESRIGAKAADLVIRDESRIVVPIAPARYGAELARSPKTTQPVPNPTMTVLLNLDRAERRSTAAL